MPLGYGRMERHNHPLLQAQRAAPVSKPPKRLRDMNQWAKRIADIASGQVEDREPAPEGQGMIEAWEAAE